ncbi:MAG: hypothetical protein AAFP19_16330 [Bacteroidota bacterium]
MMQLKNIAFLSLLILIFNACGTEMSISPKPRGFPKVIYPEKTYQTFKGNYCDFAFEYPTYARIQQDTLFFDEAPTHPCWFDILIPDFDARVHCSYHAINQRNTFEKLREDAFKLANKHNVKASYIDEFPIKKPNEVSGFAFSIEGPAASPFQFFLSDEKNHFIRGSLYFDTQARPDSLAPILDFVKKDLMQLINTFEWEKES